ncbi:MAG: hypothetical protein ACO3YZ_06340 [Candidatus Nanopelagicaceae bacterium]|jgi:hypothetical protein
MSNLDLSKYQIIQFWERGILNDLAYVALAIRFDYQNRWKDRLNNSGIGNSIALDDDDISTFINQWSGYKPGTDREKYLTHDAVIKALQKIAKANETEVEYQQITLLDADEFLGLHKPAQPFEAIDGGRAA